MIDYQRFWALEVELCRIAGSLGMKKADMLASPDRLSYHVSETVERILWDQVDCLDDTPRLRLVRSHQTEKIDPLPDSGKPFSLN